MAQNITLMGAAYADVPAITVPKTGGGTARFDDASVTTAVESDVSEGKIFLLANGEIGIGTNQGGGTTRKIIIPEQTITTSASEQEVRIPVINELIVAGEDYILTVDGVSVTKTAISQYGGIYLIFTNDNAVSFQAYGNTIYFCTYSSEWYGAHTIKVEQEIASGGGSATLAIKEITANGTYNASSDNADGYSQVTVNVPSQAGNAMNTQVAQGINRVATTSYTAVDGQSITVEVTGTYDIYWTGFRSSTGGTNGSQLYIDDTAYGSAQTTFSNHGQSVKLTGVQLTAGQVISVRARARGTSYYMYVGNLTIVQTA